MQHNRSDILQAGLKYFCKSQDCVPLYFILLSGILRSALFCQLTRLLFMDRLAGIVGLENLCENLIAALATATGVHTPAPPGSPAESKQVAALAALVALAAGPEAALLGSGWVIILRTLSAVEALQVLSCTEDANPIVSPRREGKKDQSAEN